MENQKYYIVRASLPTRERGLKEEWKVVIAFDSKSLPTRERGLKERSVLRLKG